MSDRSRWKVVALRNGVAEAMTFECDWVSVRDGVLEVERESRDGSNVLETLHLFAPGTWLEAHPLKRQGEGNG